MPPSRTGRLAIAATSWHRCSTFIRLGDELGLVKLDRMSVSPGATPSHPGDSSPSRKRERASARMAR